jgi:exonuclease SbcD
MRIVHTSDWHLGRTLHGADLTSAHEAYLDHLVDLVAEEDVDAVLVAGDVFDRAIPPASALELLRDALGRLTSRTRVILSPGNHDSAVRLGLTASQLTDRLAIRARVEQVGEPVVVPDRDGGPGAYVYALPYLDPDLAREPLADGRAPGEDPVLPARSHSGVLGAAMARVGADLAARRAADGARVPAVVGAHAFVAGGAVSDSERDIRVGGVDVVPAGVLVAPHGAARADYVALGHLHGAQEVRAVSDGGEPPPMRYSGSPVAFSFSEENHVKSSVIVDLSGGEVATRLVPAPVLRGLRTIEGTVDELLSGRFDDAADSWLRAIVTDAARPERMHARLKERFPHLLALAHEPAGALPRAQSRAVTAASDPVDVVADFVGDAGGTPAAPEELAVVRDAVESAQRRAVAR